MNRQRKTLMKESVIERILREYDNEISSDDLKDELRQFGIKVPENAINAAREDGIIEFYNGQWRLC